MFYDGDLRSGITTAIEESKLVACFVRDEDEESTLWEDDFLKDSELSSLLSSKAILLRLLAGSQEAAFLADITPLPNVPTLVVIHDGVLKEYLAPGVSKEDFLARMKAVLGDNESQPTSRAATLTTSIDEHGHDGITRTVALPGSAPMSPRASNGIIQAVESQSQNRSSSMAAVLEERRVPLETDKKAREVADKAERAKAAAKRKEELDAGESSDPRRAADMKYALMQKKRQQDAREERERILRQIEDDKKERKAIVEERKVQAKAVAGEHTNPFMAPSSKKKLITRGDTCALQVRLFDGSTIRQRFSLTDTLEKDVRKWIDQEQQIAGSPYTFKQILAPLPNKAISVSEESGTLEDLGLVPNATLVIIPVTDYTHAYDSGLGLTGVVTGAASAGFGLVSSATGLVGSGFGFAARALGNVLGGSAPQETSAAPPAEQSPPRERERQQLYNGGGLNFESRRDQDNKED